MLKSTLILMFPPNRIKTCLRLGKRYFIRNKIINQTFQILNEDITNEILHYFSYNKIGESDLVMNTYLYIIIYELLYISVWIHFTPTHEKRKLIEKSFIHILLYIIIKENYLHLCSPHIP